MLINAETGSGKTLCYLIPILNELSQAKKNNNDMKGAIILAPTKELCA